jgi:hypothetical protein
MTSQVKRLRVHFAEMGRLKQLTVLLPDDIRDEVGFIRLTTQLVHEAILP